MIKCKYCDNEFEKLDALRRHSSRIHKIGTQQLYNEIVLHNVIPLCKCGCGETPSFISFTHGYNEWIRGHVARVENNWGHNEKAINASAETRRAQYQSGERQVWNVGLTKETDVRVKQYGEGVKTAFTNSRKKEYSKRMREHRIDGIIPTRWGIESANWKGGSSSITHLVRANSRLYTEWKFPILKKDGFKCSECENERTLEVHHDKETMSEIIQKFVSKDKEYTFDEKRNIMNEIIDYHIEHSVSGKTVCKQCHSILHPSYNL